MYLEFLDIHKDRTLASIAWRIHKLGHFNQGAWKIRNNCYQMADTLVRNFKDRERELKNKKTDKYL